MTTRVISGTRTPTSVGAPWKRLKAAGSDGYVLDDFTAARVGQGLVSVEKPGVLTGLTISNGTVVDTGRVLAMPEGGCALDGFVIRNVQARNIDAFMRLKNARNGLVEDVSAQGSERPQDGFPSGCFTDKKHPQHNITYRRVVMNGFGQWLDPDSYPNGDGFADEPDSTGMVYEDCEAVGNLDSGADLKSKGVRVERLLVARNGRNLRLWGSGTVTGLRSEDPRKAHIWLGGGPRLGDYTITDPVFVDGVDLRPHLDIDPRDDYGSVTITVVNPRDGHGRALTGETLRVRGSQRRVKVVVKAGVDVPPVPEPEPGVLTEDRVRQIVREELGR